MCLYPWDYNDVFDANSIEGFGENYEAYVSRFSITSLYSLNCIKIQQLRARLKTVLILSRYADGHYLVLKYTQSLQLSHMKWKKCRIAIKYAALNH